jgi:predicted SprT family Zn-dependent metalloprotease
MADRQTEIQVHALLLDETEKAFQRAEGIWRRDFNWEDIPIIFTNKGCNAGLASYTFDRSTGIAKDFKLRYNLRLASQNISESIPETPIHEVSHIVVAMLYGNVQAHGTAWKMVSRRLGGTGEVTHNFDVTSVKVARRQMPKPHKYRCSCKMHSVTNRVHKRMQFGGYTCTGCKGRLIFSHSE